MRRVTFLLLLVAVLPQTPTFAAGDAIHGGQLYQAKCTACHSIDYNGVGPAHKHLFGRKAGSMADYNYSPALQASKVIWDEKTIDKWLANPQKFIPGQKMGFQVASPEERADLIAYLKQATQ
ncbi:MAG: c-type cytochrome [Burkholderiaceae bacterium]|nr:c-type cytochrome [Burkholderiaceae bacterium]